MKESPRSSTLQFMLRAFRSRNYRLYFTGQGISQVGTWMQNLAQSWLVYRLTGSPMLLGLVGFASQAPLLILIPFTGVLADRWNRYKAMIAVQVGEMLIALAMALLYFTGLIRIWHIIALGVCMGVLTAADSPNRHAFIVNLVEDRSDLAGAISMNSAMFNSARLVGPSIAGLIVHLAGEGFCFLINAVSFLGIIISLLAMRFPPRQVKKKEKDGILREMQEAFSYTFHSAPSRLIILHFAWISFAAMSFTTLMPVLAKDVLRGGADRLGILMGGLGIGAVVSALLIASRKRSDDFWKLAGFSSSIFGISLVLLSFSRRLDLSILLLAIAGFGMISQMTTSNTFLQTMVDDDKRARVMAFYLLAFFGTVPLGSLMIGALAKAVGTPAAIRLAGLAAIIGSLVYLWRFSRLPKPS